MQLQFFVMAGRLTELSAQTAEITFLPYNYLIDPKLRKTVSDVDWYATAVAAA